MNGSETARVEIFGSVFCPYCCQAKRFLTEKGVAYRSREVPMALGLKLPLPVYFEMKRRSGGQTTVPQIFVDGVYYGDEDRLFADDREGKWDGFGGAGASTLAPAAGGDGVGAASREP